MEPATHITVVDRIVRYGGLCSLEMPYPEDPLTDGIGTPDPNPRNLVNWYF